MSVLGVLPFGSGPGPDGGPGLITVLGVVQTANNEIVVAYDRASESLDVQAPDSATNHRNYSLFALNPTLTAEDGSTFLPPNSAVVPRFAPAVVTAVLDEDDATQVILGTDAFVEPGVEYLLTMSSAIEGAADETFAGEETWLFTGLAQARSLRRTDLLVERFRDLAYRILPSPNDVDGATQVYEFDPNNDIAIHSGLESLKKRLVRRIFTEPGGFTHLPSYGVGMKVKSLARTGALNSLAARVAEQARKEPDVLAAAASVQIDVRTTGTFILVSLFVRQRSLGDQRILFEVAT